MYCFCYHYMSPYSQSLISKHDAEHCKGNDYDSRINCAVMVYNLFQSLFLHLLTNKFLSFHFKCGILIKMFFTSPHNALCTLIITLVWILFLLLFVSQTWFLSLFIYWWNNFTSMNNVLWMFLPPADDTVWNTTCAANDRNVLMCESVSSCIWFLWTNCMIMWMNLL